MKIRRAEVEFFHADGRTEEITWRRLYSLFAILRTRLKNFSFNLLL